MVRQHFFFVAALVKPQKRIHVHVSWVQYCTILVASMMAANCHRLMKSGCDDSRQILDLQALGNLRVIIVLAAVS